MLRGVQFKMIQREDVWNRVVGRVVACAACPNTVEEGGKWDFVIGVMKDGSEGAISSDGGILGVTGEA